MMYKTEDKKVSVFIVSPSRKILLIKTNPALYKESYWTVVNGTVDNGEEFEDAALREVSEETNLKLSHLIDSGYACEYEYPKANKRTKKVFIGLVKETEVRLNEENISHKWVTLAEFKRYFKWGDPEKELDNILNKIKNLRRT